MKIYHTEIQADYDALMVELEKQGCKWFSGRKPIEATTHWKIYSSETCVKIDKKVISYNEKGYYAIRYPSIPIIKYKAKADEKMRFTKENVGKLFNEHDKYICFSINDLQDEILNLDDTPEKVVVPKCFDDWYREIKGYWKSDSSAKQFALWKLCQQGFGHSFEDVRGRKISYASDLARWLRKNEMLAIDAILNGYTIEKKVLYYIPLPHLETSDGLQQVLSKRENDTRYFASRPNEKLKQRFTKEELAQVPEIYKFYATLIEEEEE